MEEVLSLIGRSSPLFKKDIQNFEEYLSAEVSSSKFLVLGGGGTIGQAVSKEIFRRNPLKLHVVDISENNMVEFVRDIRSSLGYIDGDFKTFILDIDSPEYDAFILSDGEYDYVLNLSALKHVRSERDPYTLMRMIGVNIFNTKKTIQQSIDKGVKKYFCVSTDKAANPVNMMGASKRIMEMFLMKKSREINISTARFANVAFSDGSLLHSFRERIEKKQPLVAPDNIRRYFVTSNESGELCLMSALLGENRDIFFPKLNQELNLITFSEIAVKYLKSIGLSAKICVTEEEARKFASSLPDGNQWPLLLTASDTTGEKEYEEFFTDTENLELDSFESIGVIKNKPEYDERVLENFEKDITKMKSQLSWTKKDLVNLFSRTLKNFYLEERDKFLDEKM
tara:strand:- start:11576 stop:12766 length:1191 start_codon:yes stop_codon:yes gene_type:complete